MLRCPIRSKSLCLSAVALAMIAASGCPQGGDPVSRRAEKTCRETMSEDPQYAAYATAEAAASESALAQQIVKESVESDDFERSLAAVRGLAADPDEASRPLLRQAFDQKKGPIRLWAAIGLGHLGDEEALEWLSGQLGELGGPIKSDAALALAEHGKSETVKSMLVEMIDSGDQLRQDEAYATLGRIAEPWTTELLLKGLESEHGEERREAIAALGRSGDASVARKIARFANTQGLVFVTLEALGELGDPDSEPTLRAMMKKDEPLVKAYAGVALWKLGSLDDPFAELGPLSASPDPGVRRALAEQLGGIEGDTQAVQLLVTLLEDADDADVRLDAARSLRALAPEGVDPYLVTAASDADYRVATTALAALRRTADAAVGEQLLPLLESENPYVRVSAAMTILDARARGAAAGS